MPYTFNGIGTKYYGKREFEPDESYVTTEWITLLYVPLLPIRSLRVIRNPAADTSHAMGGSEGYFLLNKTWPNPIQVISTYAFLGLVACWLYFIKNIILGPVLKQGVFIWGVVSVLLLLVPFLFLNLYRRFTQRHQPLAESHSSGPASSLPAAAPAQASPQSPGNQTKRAKGYYLLHFQQQSGPFTLRELCEMNGVGQIKPGMQYRFEDESSWQPIVRLSTLLKL